MQMVNGLISMFFMLHTYWSAIQYFSQFIQVNWMVKILVIFLFENYKNILHTDE